MVVSAVVLLILGGAAALAGFSFIQRNVLAGLLALIVAAVLIGASAIVDALRVARDDLRRAIERSNR